MQLKKPTPEQEADIPNIIEKFAKRAIREDWDPKAAAKAMRECYKVVGEPKPKIYLHESPKAAIRKINQLAGNKGKDLVWYEPHSGAGWCHWRAFFYFFHKHFGVAECLVPHFRLDESGAFFWWYFKGHAHLCAPPKMSFDRGHIGRREPFRFHCSTGPACLWPDGFAIYIWKGIDVPKKWIMEPEKVTKEEILRIGNAERRRAIVEILGNDRTIKVLGAKVRQRDDFGELIEVNTQDDGERKGLFCRVVCPSSGREYLLRTDPSVKTCREGLAAIAQLGEEEYEFLVET